MIKYIVVLMVLVMVSIKDGFAGGSYWWLNDPNAFTPNSVTADGNSSYSGQQTGNCCGGSSSAVQSAGVKDHGSSNSGIGYYGQVNSAASAQTGQVPLNIPATTLVLTECPSGTKCVANDFCDQNGIMSSYRLSLTHKQLDNRGRLASCMLNQRTGIFGACCGLRQTSQTGTARPLSVISPHNINPSGFQQHNNPSQSSLVPLRGEAVGSCPVISVLPPIESCAGIASNCWSVGQPDSDCPRNALCCFDGCANTCQGLAPKPNQPKPQNGPNRPARPVVQEAVAQRPTAQESNSFPQLIQIQPNNRPTAQSPSDNAQIPLGQKKPIKRPQPQVIVMRPSQTTYPQPPRRPITEFVEPSFNQQKIQPGQLSQVPIRRRQQAKLRPYVSCPSAMKCILREYCDFKGVMTDQPLTNLTKELEALRVPLIPCVNPITRNIDVCCRNPNYKDPWPKQNTQRNNNNQGYPSSARSLSVASPQIFAQTRSNTGGGSCGDSCGRTYGK